MTDIPMHAGFGRRSRIRLGLVVPSLEEGGGVPAVADFLCRAAERTGRYDIQVVSLATSAIDDSGVMLSRPASWWAGVQMQRGGVWRGRPFVKVGAVISELEFQRYRPRPALQEILADCDLVQVVCGSPAWGNSVLGLGKPVALQVATRAVRERVMRDRGNGGLLHSWRRIMTGITNRLDDRALRRVDAIQVENAWMLDYARRLNSGRLDVDIRYAPPGVDADLFCPSAVTDTSPTPFILCVGRFIDPRKNIALLLEAFRQLCSQRDSPLDLILAGSVGPSQDFWDRCEAMRLRHRVKFIYKPSIEELVKLYQRATVFALTSDEEGLGVVVLEAMACGVPVVSTRSGGPDGIITHGVDGFLVDRNDAAAICSHLAIVLSNQDARLAMGLKARQKIESRFSSNVAGQAFVDMWERLVEKKWTGKRDSCVD